MLAAQSSGAVAIDVDDGSALGAEELLATVKYTRWRLITNVQYACFLFSNARQVSTPYGSLSTSSDCVLDVQSTMEEEEGLEQSLLTHSTSASEVPQLDNNPNGTSFLDSISSSICSSFTGSEDPVTITSPNLSCSTQDEELWNCLEQSVRNGDLNSLREKYGGARQVASLLGSHLRTGLHAADQSQFSEISHESYFPFLVKACSYTVLLLLVSSGLSIAVELKEQGLKGDWWHDGAGTLVAVLLLLFIPSVLNFVQARNAANKANRCRSKVSVVRNEQVSVVDMSDVVVRDVVVLKKTDRVPGDGLLVSGKGLVLNEMLRSKIDCDRNPFLYSGSEVKDVDGDEEYCKMIVTSLGTNYTALAASNTILAARINTPNSFIDYLTFAVSILIAIVLLIQLFCINGHNYKYGNHDDSVWPDQFKVHVSANWIMQFLEKIVLKSRGKIWVLISLISASVFQQGIPFMINLALVRWNRKVACDLKAMVQNSFACGTMGVFSVMCIDITGGLMHKPMVSEIRIGERDIGSGLVSNCDQDVVKAFCQGICVSRSEDSWPIDDLLSEVKSICGANMELEDKSFEVFDYMELTSNSNKRCNGVLVRRSGETDETKHVHWTGAASDILELCSHYYDSEGECQAMGSKKTVFEREIARMEGSGLNPIAFAHRQAQEEAELEEGFGLNLVALVGLEYHFDDDIKTAVQSFRDAGVCIKLLSEDELPKAISIARKLGGFSDDSFDMTLEGERLRTLSGDERMETIDQSQIVAGLLPRDKLIMVEDLQKKGHIVVLFGGSTTGNSAALKEADVGIVVDNWSTEMTRKSCDIIVSHLDLSSVPKLMETGRSIYYNIQKFTQLQLTTCISGLLIVFATTIFSENSSLAAFQIIYAYVIMCLLGGPMMMIKFPVEDKTSHQSAKRNDSLISKVIWRNVVVRASCQACVLLVFQFKGGSMLDIVKGNEKVIKAMVFNSFILCQVFNPLKTMNLTQKKMLVIVLGSYWFLLAFGVVMAVQVLVVWLAKCLASRVALNKVQFAFCFVIVAMSLGLDWIVNFILVALEEWSWLRRSGGSHSVMPNRSFFFGFPLFVCMFFSVSYFFNPEITDSI